MPWLLGLGVAAALTYFVMHHQAAAASAAGKVVAPNALTLGKWYRVTVSVTPAGIAAASPTALAVQGLLTAEAKAQGFVGSLAVIVKQNADGTVSGTITGPLLAGQAGIASTANMTVLQVEEVNAPK